MRSFLSSALLVVLVAGCAEHRPEVVSKPYIPHVPRIPGNYEAAARLPVPPRPEPQQPSSSGNFLEEMDRSDRVYCSTMVTPTHSSYRWCNKHSYPTKYDR
ncbi:hypothetical protein J8I29_24095 [Labrys sp. LIt4]|uniref:hypothetical protein n=1 Tax=Labrys TaxID=204476 RepID=UPI0011B1C822|nr:MULTISPECIES: hypothetical protein [Labrys]MBP0582430.1 hypothetical protein [Labrys sp. LIt4]